MDFHFPIPTLQHLALVKTAADLWTIRDFLSPKMQYVTGKLEYHRQEKRWIKIDIPPAPFELIEKEVVQEVAWSKVRLILRLPKKLKKQLSYYNFLIDSQIFDWCEYLCQHLYLHQINLKNLRWTQAGTIDRLESARVVSTDPNLSVSSRYSLACAHFLADRVQSLWKKMSEEEQSLQAQLRDIIHSSNNNNYLPLLRQFWTCHFTGKQAQILLGDRTRDRQNLSNEDLACCRATRTYTPNAVKYFFDKLELFERTRLFTNVEDVIDLFLPERHINPATSSPRLYVAETMCFLFSRMNAEQQTMTLGRYPRLLYWLLVWPYQRFFLQALKRMTWECLSRSDFYQLLMETLEILGTCCNSSSAYGDIFKEFWCSSLDKFKRCVLHPDNFPWIKIKNCFEMGEEDVCGMMFKEADDEEKQELLLTNPYTDVEFSTSSGFKYAIDPEHSKLLRFFIERCGVSKETVDRFKEKLTYRYDLDEKETREFVQFLDNFNPDARK